VPKINKYEILCSICGKSFILPESLKSRKPAQNLIEKKIRCFYFCSYACHEIKDGQDSCRFCLKKPKAAASYAEVCTIGPLWSFYNETYTRLREEIKDFNGFCGKSTCREEHRRLYEM